MSTFSRLSLWTLSPAANRVAWIWVVSSAFLQALVFRNATNPDGISYLDMARLAANGNGTELINPYWSPLFPAFLSFLFKIFQPEYSAWYPGIHGVQAILLILSYWAFRGLVDDLRAEGQQPSSSPTVGASWVRSDLFLAGLFLWSHHKAGLVSAVTPDLLGNFFLFLGGRAGLQWIRKPRWQTGLGFGLAQGCAGLSKAFYIPYGGVTLVLSLFLISRDNRKWAQKWAGLTGISFFLVLCLWWIPLRFKAPEYPWGAAGALNQAWFIARATPPYIHWQAEEDSPQSHKKNIGRPIHPTQMIRKTPPAYQFEWHVPVTYAPWYDPSYWFAGLKVKPTLVQRGERLLENLRLLGASAYFRTAFALLGLLLFSSGVPNFFERVGRRERAGSLWLFVSASIGFSAYLSLDSLPRYWSGLSLLIFASLALSNGRTGKARSSVAGGILFFMILTLGIRAEPWPLLREEIRRGFPPSPNVELVRYLTAGVESEHPIPTGSRVAVIGNTIASTFLQLAKFQVIAEIPLRGGGVQQFCEGSEQERLQAVEALLSTKVERVIVLNEVPCRFDFKNELKHQPRVASRLMFLP